MSQHETARLAALRRYRILDTEPEQAFDDLTLLASQILETPIALITLLDDHRQWFKSRVGISVTETARSIAFCAHTIQQRRPVRRSGHAGRRALPRQSARCRRALGPLLRRGAAGHARRSRAWKSLRVLIAFRGAFTPEQHAALDALRRQAIAQLELRLNVDELTASAPRSRSGRGGAGPTRAGTAECARGREAPQRAAAILLGLPIQHRDSRRSRSYPDRDRRGAQALRNKPGVVGHELEIELALQEALANAIRHGCQGDRTKSIQCCVTYDAGDVLIVVRDPARDSTSPPWPDPLEETNVLKGNGRGIFLINQLMEDVRFADGGRELHMRKGRDSSRTTALNALGATRPRSPERHNGVARSLEMPQERR